MDTLARTTDFALVVHVWHLDVLDDLAAAADNLPPGVDRFVTVPDSFSAAQRARVATALPGAVLVAVENAGQDVGALFQLMGKVDLGRYDFICKIHTKKGPNMPDEWRTALLKGVLGSRQQVDYVIERFRSNKRIMLAGARQLFLHGPSYLYKNSENIEVQFSRITGDFDFRHENWGFIAGTCFWIRVSILYDLAECSPIFIKQDYTSDGTTAHALERMFGMAVAISHGSVLLQDLRFPERSPDEEPEFPSDLLHHGGDLLSRLTPLATSGVLSPAFAPKKHGNIHLASRRRIVIFASYSADGILPHQVVPYLKGLRAVSDDIIFVCDNELLSSEIEKLSPYVVKSIVGRHGEYDFGSYRRGYEWARGNGILHDADDLIFCNDSCYGPIDSFVPIFAHMESKNLDFWGATDSYQFSYHLQSYFISIASRAFNSAVFRDFIDSITVQRNVQAVILNYEVGLTKALRSAGFKCEAFFSNQLRPISEKDRTYGNIPIFPLYLMSRGLPLIKTKALKIPFMNMDGQTNTLKFIENKSKEIHDACISDFDVVRLVDSGSVAFSIIMPVCNIFDRLKYSICAIFAQNFNNYELIIVGDETSGEIWRLIAQEFPDEISCGKIRYISLGQSLDVSIARNIGISVARNPWIVYVNSDSNMRPYMLTVYAGAVISNPDTKAFYSRILIEDSGVIVGEEFSHEDLLEKNCIDLGVFVHHRDLFHECGGFDVTLGRLADWDIIIRYTRKQRPIFMPRVCLSYQVDKNASGDTFPKSSILKQSMAIHSRHGPKPTVSTAIVGYNHEDFLVEAIESALEQKGDFYHEILLSDDGSSDATARIMARYAEKYPKVIRNITRGGNHGISANYRHCFREASGNYVAILEGDDYWTDPEKNLRQAEFLKRHDTAPMVFSRIELFDMRNNSRRLLKRQEGLPELVSAREFAADQNLNLIVNLSCCMFRKDVMTALPSVLYDPRLSEIALAFYLDRLGPLGFLPGVMSTYRLNGASVWTGADQASQLRQAIAVRQMALKVARPIYHATLRRHIAEKEAALAALTKTGPSPRAA